MPLCGESGKEGGCLYSVLMSLDIIRFWSFWRRTLVRDERSYCSFLIPYDRVPVKHQSKYATFTTRLLTFILWHQVLPPNLSVVSFCLMQGHIDWKDEWYEACLYCR